MDIRFVEFIGQRAKPFCGTRFDADNRRGYVYRDCLRHLVELPSPRRPAHEDSHRVNDLFECLNYVYNCNVADELLCWPCRGLVRYTTI